MTGKREATRRDLTRRLLEAATRRIERQGLDGLRARDITADAGCGLGTIYKCYADLDDLILHVNSNTLKRLETALAAATQSIDDPEEKLVALALAYLDFAQTNYNAWSALFDHRMADRAPVPEWHLAELSGLFGYVIAPLSKIDPSLDETELVQRARSIFSATHGIVTLSIEGRLVGVEEEVVRDELRIVTRALLRGLATPE